MNTFKTFLMRGTESSGSVSWAKLIDIKDYPDLFAAPEMLETTTLSDPGRTHEPGIDENEALTFTANYSLSDFTTLKALEGTELDLAVWFGATVSGSTVTATGSDGKFKFKGKIAVTILGKGVNEVREMQITVALSSNVSVDSAA